MQQGNNSRLGKGDIRRDSRLLPHDQWEGNGRCWVISTLSRGGRKRKLKGGWFTRGENLGSVGFYEGVIPVQGKLKKQNRVAERRAGETR